MGRTPAVNVVMIGATSESVPFLDVITKTIPPGETQTFTLPLAEPLNEKSTSIDGEVAYWDVFGRKHKTQFCFSAWEDNGRPRFAPCSTHNVSDDEEALKERAAR